MPVRITLASLLLALALLAGCATQRSDGSLYAALGGEAGVARLVDALIAEYHADPRIAPLFADTDDAYLHARLSEQICQLAGGGCDYTGLPMDEAHSGMGITEAEFSFFVEDSRNAMTRIGVPVPTQNRLLALLAPMRGDVIHQ